MVQVEKHSILVADWRIVYDQRFLGSEGGANLNKAILRMKAIKDLIIATSMSMSEVNL